ncbi:phosphatidylinositol 3,4,5-trisphosphate-dependent Rac exchanger 1 protein-like [Mucor ambiguus]|uniref:Phosphatidylinositol 3,4,5-trisphosphate-dependent Rac exchanger 1 protein-like n=1 Tax=Mucor ambiguus TaxID=91626 RepID=A0A0C9M5I3_9FUNG|nr:phosphatidylinositol 3,4,5-trisphosphate-dependent Rac exchanger 1 protein-like [Mucor ambiguus]
MKSALLQHPQQQHDINDHHHMQQNCCCCCCYCCCYHQQSSSSSGSNNVVSSSSPPPPPQIPPWSSFSPPSPCDVKPTLDSICSCCSCISHDQDTPTQAEDEQEPENQHSTGCTTPTMDEHHLKMTEAADKLQRKKMHAIEELLQTERDYVQDLSYLVQVCLEVLSRQTWIAPDHKSIIIRNSHDILSFHKQFIISYDTLSVYNCNWSRIARTFLDQIGQFSLYKHYCDLHAEAWALLSEYRDRPEWACFLKDCTILDSYSIPLNLNTLSTTAYTTPTAPVEQQQQAKKLHFEDYLIKPVQRICRYQLLIKEIIRYTSPHTAEYDLWNSVLAEMQDIVGEIDDLKFQREMKERTDRFIERLDGDWRISKRHVSQLGNLLLAGAIEITYSALGQSVSKPRYLGCFIFQTYIIMVRPKKVTSYEPKHWFPLRMADFEDLGDIEGQREHAFVVKCKKHTFAFSASCSQEKQLWVKKLQEAIVTAKIEASDENLSAQDYIVSSLPGITSKRSPQSIRLSRSFTNILDMTLAGAHAHMNSSNDQILSFSERKTLRRSASTSIQFEDIMRMTQPSITTVEPPPPPPPPLLPIITNANHQDSNNSSILKKRYSADYSYHHPSPNSGFALKPRNNSEMYIKPDAFGGKRRPSSLDLLSFSATTTSNTSMIGKMSFQFKSNHQNALRVTVDHKLRDVCTQEYLRSRAWHMRDREHNASLQSSIDLLSLSTTADSHLNSPVIGNANSNNNDLLLKKRKSSSFIRSSASSFSLMIPKRTSESRQSNSSRLQQQQIPSEDVQSNRSSSCASSMDRCVSPMTNKSNNSRRPSQSSQLLRHMSQNRGCFSESPHSFESSEYSFATSQHQKRLEHSPSRRSILVGKVKKAASVDSKTSKLKWPRHKQQQQHEELTQLKISDRPCKTTTTIASDNNEEQDDDNNEQEENKGVQQGGGDLQTTLSAFAYASTPPPPVSKRQSQLLHSTTKDGATSNNKWKNRLSLIRPTAASFLKLNNNSTSNTAIVHGT